MSEGPPPRAARLFERARVLAGRSARRDLAALAGVRPAPDAAGHLLLAPPGGGNVGDQALFEAFLQQTDEPVTVLANRPGDVVVPAADAPRVAVRTLPPLVYGAGPGHDEAVREFGALLRRAARFSVIGADIMDGRYSLRASVNRSVLARAAASAGVETRVLGFSWSAAPRVAARRALVAAGRAGAALLVRDPVSFDRLAGVPGIRRSADLVFAAHGTDPSLAERIDSRGRPLALVNVSGLIARTGDRTAEYAGVVRRLREMDRHVVLLPHVSRPKSDDVAACRAVAERVGPAGVTLLEHLPTPDQVRALASRAEVALTGRMHLAVMSLAMSTPVVALATQGKVEGLMALFGTPERCVEPAPGFAAVVLQRLEQIIADPAAERRRVEAALPAVIGLAEENLRPVAGAGR